MVGFFRWCPFREENVKSKFISMTFWVGMCFLLFWTNVAYCQHALPESEWVEKTGRGQVNWTAGYIEAAGAGAPPNRDAGIVEARPAAFRAARAEACRNLLETAMFVQVDSSNTIKDLAQDNEILQTQLEGFMQGSQVADQEYRSDDTAQVTLRIPLYGNLSQIVVPKVLKQKNQVSRSVRLRWLKRHPALDWWLTPAVSAPVLPCCRVFARKTAQKSPMLSNRSLKPVY